MDVSDWTAVAIQDAYQRRKREYEAAKEKVQFAEDALVEAKKVEIRCQAAVEALKVDAGRLNVTISL